LNWFCDHKDKPHGNDHLIADVNIVRRAYEERKVLAEKD